ncbi:hypothetical protein [Sodalis-like endosymbiont of Proechinophthirus fluctus]|uniref:hypothetical protein n=1 Tax=Sodalis-like endosymbiont of Proechinophthirus fluctus TaxID=1462730 RepID=UPI00164F36C7|nr:hypothetical protein [Sodalis-like endosymbiont of Proechinophthirus fluctus]
MREAIKTLAAKGEWYLPRLTNWNAGITPCHQWYFLDQNLLEWWLKWENFHGILERIS